MYVCFYGIVSTSIYLPVAFLLIFIATIAYAVYVAAAIIAYARDSHTQSIDFYHQSWVYILIIYRISKRSMCLHKNITVFNINCV